MDIIETFGGDGFVRQTNLECEGGGGWWDCSVYMMPSVREVEEVHQVQSIVFDSRWWSVWQWRVAHWDLDEETPWWHYHSPKEGGMFHTGPLYGILEVADMNDNPEEWTYLPGTPVVRFEFERWAWRLFSDIEIWTYDDVRGPDNMWWHALEHTIPDDLTGQDCERGNILRNATLTDQYGDEVELYQFYGQVIALDIFTGWCTECHGASQGLQWNIWDLYRSDLHHPPDGVVVIGIMEEDNTGGPPDPEYAAAYAERYGLTFPVLVDPDRLLFDCALYPARGYPRLVAIDRAMIINSISPPDIFTGEFVYSHVTDLL
jgi:peroxiredoxin